MITGMPRIAIAATDFDAMTRTFNETLNLPLVDISASSVQTLGAKLAMCVPEGGSNIELMAPADPAAPLSQSLSRFLERRGEGLFALMLEAPDPNAEADAVSARGLNVLPLMAGAHGRDIHPNSTHGVLIRIYPVDSFSRSSPAAGAAGDLSGIDRVIVAVRDLDHAVSIYGGGLGLRTDPVVSDPERGVRSVLAHPPTGGAIELVAVDDPSQPFGGALAAFLDDRGEGMFALVLRCGDPSAVADTLARGGIDVAEAEDARGVFEIARASAFGALIRIEAA